MGESTYVGSRIRLYRRAHGLSLKQLASLIGKSVSCVSKYETGAIVIDVETLFDVARALGVSVSQLVDYPVSAPEGTAERPGGFFQKANLFYLYYYFGVSQKVYVSAMEIVRGPQAQRDDVIVYCDIDDVREPGLCNYLFQGKIEYSDLCATLLLRNANSSTDVEFAYLKVPFANSSRTTGLLTMISERLRNPCALKMVVSVTPLAVDDALLAELSVCDKDSLASLRRANLFVIE